MKAEGERVFDKAVFALPGFRRIFALACVLTVLRGVAVVGQAFGLANAIVGVWSGGDVESALGWVALFFGSFVARQAIVSCQSALLERFGYERANDLRERALGAVFRLGPAVVQKRGSAAVASSVIEGVEHIENYLSIVIGKMAGVVLVPLVLLLCIFPLDWVSGIIALACYPFIILYMIMIGYTAKDDAARRHGEFERMSNHFVDALRGMDTLRAFGKSRGYGESIFAASERFREITMKTLRVAQLSGAVLDTFATLALAAVAIMLGFRLVDGSLAFFPALAVLVMVPEYFRPIRDFAADYHATLDGKTALAAVQDLIAEGEDASLIAAAVVPKAEKPSVVLDHVGVSYGEHAALSDATFRVAGPCKVGIVGASGSGKSTLLQVLGGFSDLCAGSVGACGGQPGVTLRGTAWQQRAAFIPQDPYIFHASLRDNVAFYAPDATKNEVLRALDLVGMGDVARDLPQGIDTLIGEGARALSGGQAQRIALARALLDPSRDVLLLDEPTAHLDIETEYELKERMLPLMADKLVFFATHRLHWVDSMDYIVVLDRGEITWQGPAREARDSEAFRLIGGDLR